MLSRQLVRHHCSEAIGDKGRNRAMVLITLVITIVALLVLGIFLVITTNVNFYVELVGLQLQMQVYLIDDVEVSEVESLAGHLAGMNEVLSVEFVPKVKALEEMQNRLGKEISRFIRGNPFPDSFRVTLKDGSDVDKVVQSLSVFESVEDFEYGGEFGRQMRFALKIIRRFVFVLGGVLVCAAVLIISNTINLTVISRRSEIETMKLIGASDSFIAFPFIIEGVFIGMFAALAAFLILSILYNSLSAELGTILFLPHANGVHVIFSLFGGLFGCGFIAGFLGSVLSVRRLLRQQLT